MKIRRVFVYGIVWFGGVVMGTGVLAAKNQYEGIPYPPFEFFEAIVGYADRQDYPALSKCLEYLKPVNQAIRKDWNVDPCAEIEKGIFRKDAAIVRKAVWKLIFFDMKVNLQNAQKADDWSKQREAVQMAYVNYMFLAPVIARQSKDQERALREMLKKIYRSEAKSDLEKALMEFTSLVSKFFLQREESQSP